MHLTRSRLSTVLAAGLGAVLSAGIAAQPAHAAGTPATATFRLDHGTVFAGQTVRLSRTSVADDEDGRLLYSEINWGDGTTGALFDNTTESHAYARSGTFRVTVAVHDLDGTGTAVFTGTDTVRVAPVAGTYRLSSRSVWRGLDTTQAVTLSLGGVPATATKVSIGWDDGTESVVGRTSRPVAHRFRYSGNHTVTVALVNGAGRSAPRTVGTVKVSTDYTAPSVALKKPAKANRVASWRTIRGTVADRGAGVQAVVVVLAEQRGGRTYYYNGKTFVKGKVTKAKRIIVRPSKGTWSVKIKGLKKGTLVVAYAAVDKVGNGSSAKSKVVRLTR